MARKKPSFRQLLAYMHKPGKETSNLTHNLYAEAGGNNWNAVAEEFEVNSLYLPSRANGNSLYHEVLVLDHQDHISQHRQGEMLLDIAQSYLTIRAPHQLAYGRLHFNTDYVHIHLMISSNGPRSARRERLTKAQFRAIQTEIEDYQIQHYPELGHERLYDYEHRKAERVRVTAREYEAAKREGTKPTKERLRVLLGTEMTAARSYDELVERLYDAGYLLYQRGKSWGVESETGRRHRLKTIGLDRTFEEVRTRFALREDRYDDLASLQRSRIDQEADRELSDFIPEDER